MSQKQRVAKMLWLLEKHGELTSRQIKEALDKHYTWGAGSINSVVNLLGSCPLIEKKAYLAARPHRICVWGLKNAE